MYRFEHVVPMPPTAYPEPPADDRSGPPLSQGFLFVLIGTVASEYCDDATLDLIAHIDPMGWYHGQLLENVLNAFEDQNPDLPDEIGKNIYYTLRSQFAAMGMQTPTDVIQFTPTLWQTVTRGDSGVWRVELVAPNRARYELEQPYNCLFEAGAVKGSLEAFDAVEVHVDHSQCMRDGAPYCVFDVTWREEAR